MKNKKFEWKYGIAFGWDEKQKGMAIWGFGDKRFSNEEIIGLLEEIIGNFKYYSKVN